MIGHGGRFRLVVSAPRAAVGRVGSSRTVYVGQPRAWFLSLLLAVIAASACGSSAPDGYDAAGPTADHSDGGGDERSAAGRDLAFGDRGDPAGTDRSGRISQPPPAVIVAHATGPSIVVRSAPADAAEPVVELPNPTEVGGPLAFQVVESVSDDPERMEAAAQGRWLEVHLPIRPNGSTGWVRRDEVELSRNPFRIEIDTGDHRLEIFRENEPWLGTTVAIGTGETPTPIGEFYIIELLQPPSPDGVYGPFAFGLSGFSETLTSYAGGDGVIGIHGTNDPAALGTDVSHGCIRVANQTIEAMAGVIPLGTPVIITT